MNFSKRTWPNWVPHFLWIRRECPRCNSLKFKQAELRPVRWPAEHVCAAAGSLHVLLAAVLLVRACMT